MKKNIIYFFILTLGLFSSVLFLIQEIIKKEEDYLILSILVASSIFGFCIGLFIKRYTFIEFLKILLPALATIAATVWLLSTGYLNLQRAILQNEIINFQEEKDSLILNIDITREAIKNAQFDLNRKKEKIANYEKEINVLKELNLNKTEAVGRLTQSNLKYEKKLIEKNKIVVDSINLFLRRKGYQEWVFTTVFCVDVIESSDIILKVYDSNQEILTKNDISIYTFSLMPGDCIPQIGKYDEKTNKFTLKHSTRRVKEEKLPNRIFINVKSKMPNCDENSDFQFETTFDNAEYKVTLYRYKK